MSVVLVEPVLIFIAVGLLASVQRHALVDRVGDIQPFGILLIWTEELMPFVLLCGVFTCIYKFVPHTLVTVRAARLGGLTAALLWGLAGEAFAPSSQFRENTVRSILALPHSCGFFSGSMSAG